MLSRPLLLLLPLLSLLLLLLFNPVQTSDATEHHNFSSSNNKLTSQTSLSYQPPPDDKGNNATSREEYYDKWLERKKKYEFKFVPSIKRKEPGEELNNIGIDRKYSCGSCCYGDVLSLQEYYDLNLDNSKKLDESFYKKLVLIPNVLDAKRPLVVAGSENVSDDALYEGALTMDRMVMKRRDLLDILTNDEEGVHMMVLAKDEMLTDVPEYSWLDVNKWWWVRGVGATSYAPVTSCAEENLMCYPGGQDPYKGEHICVHENSHTLSGSNGQLPTTRYLTYPKVNNISLQERIDELYLSAVREQNLWPNTYASTNSEEYWAEGVQAYYDVDGEGPEEGNEIHNHVNTRAELLEYDRPLHDLVNSIFEPNVEFPCPSIKPCDCSTFICPWKVNQLAPSPVPSAAPSAPPSISLTSSTTYEKNELSTTLLTNRQQFGNMFDVVALSDIRITDFDVHLDDTNNKEVNVQVWHKTGTYATDTVNSESWTTTYNKSVVGLGIGDLTNLGGLSQDIVLQSGERHALYITVTGDVKLMKMFKHSTQNVVFVEDDHLQIYSGKSIGYPFAYAFKNFVWSGSIYYLVSTTPNDGVVVPAPSSPSDPPPADKNYLKTTLDAPKDQAGIVFDVVAKTQDIVITSLDFHTLSKENVDIEIYTKIELGSFFPDQRNPAMWQKHLQSKNIQGLGLGKFTRLDGLKISISRTETQALYITLTTNELLMAIDYPRGVVAAENDFLQILGGNSMRYLFGRNAADNLFSGGLLYNLK